MAEKIVVDVEESETEAVVEQEEVETKPEPNKDDFESDEEYQAAVDQHKTAASLEEEKKFWQETDEEPLDDVPATTHIRVKQKLKGQLRESNEELEALKQEVADLKKARESLPVLKRPKEDDFETDEEYETAKDKYENDLAQQRYDRIEAERKQAEFAKKQLESVSVAVDDHYTRADEFVKKYSIPEDKFKKADLSIKKAVESVMPGRGEVIVNHIISVLGEGSEKVLFHVGAKSEKLHKLQSLLLEDNTGMKAAIYLGEQKGILTNPIKRTTRAPIPTPKLKGDDITGSNGAALKKAYDKAHKAGRLQEAYNAKKAARAAGVNVSTWL